MANNKLHGGPQPLTPWAPQQPLDHKRLNAMQDGPVRDITVKGPGVTCDRNGSTVSVLIQKQSHPAPFQLLDITGDRVGGGVYQVSVLERPTTSVDSAANVGTGHFGPVVNDDATAINLHELGLSTHKLTHADNTLQTYCLGMPWGRDDAGRACFLIVHFWTDDCEEEEE